MARFLRQIEGYRSTGGLAELESQQREFRQQQASGLIEISDGSARLALVVFARGTMAGTYLLEEK